MTTRNFLFETFDLCFVLWIESGSRNETILLKGAHTVLRLSVCIRSSSSSWCCRVLCRSLVALATRFAGCLSLAPWSDWGYEPGPSRMRQGMLGGGGCQLWLTRYVGKFGFRKAICFLEESTMLIRIELRICDGALYMMCNGGD